ncbi:VOC family protein [Actinoplanes sp. TBRC 11911]|uniref:VOC family protein n=1 Tax=Actinoplanes sp. TBRC 11911 TaxID=2729386 RepID=UPI001B7D6A8B|nr:hypothetical protein [Actinoplanes sp. TBRC 11911]
MRTFARFVIDSLDNSLPIFERLTGTRAVRFPYREWEVGVVGDFLLVQIPPGTEPAWLVRALCAVDDLDETLRALTEGEAEILSGPNDVPIGRNILARHPDGLVIEYLLPNADLTQLFLPSRVPER